MLQIQAGSGALRVPLPERGAHLPPGEVVSLMGEQERPALWLRRPQRLGSATPKHFQVSSMTFVSDVRP